jgi:hypothetical protein
MILYKPFPLIPKHIVKQVLRLVSAINFQTNDFNLTTDDTLLESIKQYAPNFNDKILGVAFNEAQQHFKEPIASFAFIKPPDDLTIWVKENIPIPYKAVNIQVMTGGTHVVPHVDEIRTGGLNYIIRTGGPAVKTAFYKPKLAYEEFKVVPQTAFLLDTIDEVYSEILPANNWHILDVTRIHSVNNIVSSELRIAVTVSL